MRKLNLVDRSLAYLSPETALRRAVARQKLTSFGFDGAKSNRYRDIAPISKPSEAMTHQIDRIHLIDASRDMLQNCGFFKGIILCFVQYTLGSLRYQSRTGDMAIDQEYESYFDRWCKSCDITGRTNFLGLAQLDLISTLIDGDVFNLIVRDGSNGLKLQGVEADRIGGRFTPTAGEFIGGVKVDSMGHPVAYQLYDRSIMGQYTNPRAIDAQNVIHLLDPFRHDQYRGIPAFHAGIENIRDLHEIIQFEKQAVKWGSAQTGVITTQAGEDISGQYFNKDEKDANNNTMNAESIQPGTLQRLFPGEEMKQFLTDRPSKTFDGFIQALLRESSIALGLPLEFVYSMAGLTGPAVRMVSQQAQRTFARWQTLLIDKKLDRIKNLVLLDGISKGELQESKNWDSGRWFFPAAASIDAGRDANADINMNRAGLRTASDIFSEQGKDFDEEVETLAREARRRLDLAEKYDIPVTMIATPTPNLPPELLTPDEEITPEPEEPKETDDEQA